MNETYGKYKSAERKDVGGWCRRPVFQKLLRLIPTRSSSLARRCQTGVLSQTYIYL